MKDSGSLQRKCVTFCILTLMLYLCLLLIFNSSSIHLFLDNNGNLSEVLTIEEMGEMEEKFLKDDIIYEMDRRNEHLKNVCQKYNNQSLEDTAEYLRSDSNWKSIRKNFLVTAGKQYFYNIKHKFVMCLVPKAGSLSLSHAFLKMMNVKKKVNLCDGNIRLMKLSKHLNGKTWKEYENLQNVTRIINVRHPFSRLLSGFRDKIHSINKILKARNRKKLEKPAKGRRQGGGQDQVTFDEFVDYLLQVPKRRWDTHFVPAYLTCLPCYFHYDCIIKTESSQEDMKCISKKLGVNFSYQRQHVTNLLVNEKKLKHGGTTAVSENFHIHYYSLLTMKQLLGLYRLYELDFLYFNYTISPFDQYVKKG